MVGGNPSTRLASIKPVVAPIEVAAASDLVDGGHERRVDNDGARDGGEGRDGEEVPVLLVEARSRHFILRTLYWAFNYALLRQFMNSAMPIASWQSVSAVKTAESCMHACEIASLRRYHTITVQLLTLQNIFDKNCYVF